MQKLYQSAKKYVANFLTQLSFWLYSKSVFLGTFVWATSLITLVRGMWGKINKINNFFEVLIILFHTFFNTFLCSLDIVTKCLKWNLVSVLN